MSHSPKHYGEGKQSHDQKRYGALRLDSKECYFCHGNKQIHWRASSVTICKEHNTDYADLIDNIFRDNLGLERLWKARQLALELQQTEKQWQAQEIFIQEHPHHDDKFRSKTGRKIYNRPDPNNPGRLSNGRPSRSKAAIEQRKKEREEKKNSKKRTGRPVTHIARLPNGTFAKNTTTSPPQPQQEETSCEPKSLDTPDQVDHQTQYISHLLDLINQTD